MLLRLLKNFNLGNVVKITFPKLNKLVRKKNDHSIGNLAKRVCEKRYRKEKE